MTNYTKKQITRMNSLEKKFGKLEWSEYVDNDGTVMVEGYCRILQRSWLINRDGKLA